MTTTPLTCDLTPDEVLHLEQALTKVGESGADPAGTDFYDRGWPTHSLLPGGLVDFLEHFRTREPGAACLIRGLPVADDQVGPTPANWREVAGSTRARREATYLGLVAASLGEVFSWSTLQDGRLVCDVVPIQGEESQQSGHGQVLLEWHTEDAFHPQRCRYLLLFGVRNQLRTPTTLASVRDVRLPDKYRRILSQPRFLILPDDEHLRQLAQRDPAHPGLARMRRMRDEPEPVPVLFGDPARPYLRIDPYYMRCLVGDHEASAALAHLIAELEGALRDVVVDAGTLLIVDNYLAVHGRRAFDASFDGTDRWLKKAVVAGVPIGADRIRY